MSYTQVEYCILFKNFDKPGIGILPLLYGESNYDFINAVTNNQLIGDLYDYRNDTTMYEGIMGKNVFEVCNFYSKLSHPYDNFFLDISFIFKDFVNCSGLFVKIMLNTGICNKPLDDIFNEGCQYDIQIFREIDHMLRIGENLMEIKLVGDLVYVRYRGCCKVYKNLIYYQTHKDIYHLTSFSELIKSKNVYINDYIIEYLQNISSEIQEPKYLMSCMATFDFVYLVRKQFGGCQNSSKFNYSDRQVITCLCELANWQMLGNNPGNAKIRTKMLKPKIIEYLKVLQTKYIKGLRYVKTINFTKHPLPGPRGKLYPDIVTKEFSMDEFGSCLKWYYKVDKKTGKVPEGKVMEIYEKIKERIRDDFPYHKNHNLYAAQCTYLAGLNYAAVIPLDPIQYSIANPDKIINSKGRDYKNGVECYITCERIFSKDGVPYPLSTQASHDLFNSIIAHGILNGNFKNNKVKYTDDDRRKVSLSDDYNNPCHIDSKMLSQNRRKIDDIRKVLKIPLISIKHIVRNSKTEAVIPHLLNITIDTRKARSVRLEYVKNIVRSLGYNNVH
jgi:hypothetical protein